MIEEERHLLRLARCLAICSYALAGVAVVAINAAVDAPGLVLMVFAAASVVVFGATAVSARRSRRLIPRDGAPVRPHWRNLWPGGLLIAPVYTATLVIALYASTVTATTLMGGDLRTAVLPASIALAATTLHLLVPEVAIPRHTAHPRRRRAPDADGL